MRSLKLKLSPMSRSRNDGDPTGVNGNQRQDYKHGSATEEDLDVR